MARLAWDEEGERFYETGVDRGVLYVGAEDGVPWSGLISITEAPTGGDPQPYYLDGFKYCNLSSAEEFAGTIEAYGAPYAFGPCDGTVPHQNGLYVTQQPRKPFGLTYRTHIGNDVDGRDHGYNIHILYNVLAAPSQRVNSTTTDSIEPKKLSWSISTRPPALTGKKPTAHFVVKSTEAADFMLSELEDILYGSDAADPRLPSVDELLDIFTSTIHPDPQ